jgi:60 kDa SS-A/Ro ribonucleoprotein
MKGVAMTTYLDDALKSKVSPPQSQPLDSDQVKNSAGGFVYKIDDFARLRRFLILGSEGGSYYAGQRELTLKNLDAVERCIAANGVKTVDEIVDVSLGGRAPKNDQAILALALCIAKGDAATKAHALSKVNAVARIGTHLFQLVEFLDKLGTLTGRAKRRAIARWYTSKSPDKLAYQLVKYRQRNGWTHKDVLRVSHPGSIEPVDTEHAELFNWVAKGNTGATTPAIIRGFKMAQAAETTPEVTAHLVREFNLPREALKTEHLASPEVWQAMLDNGMPVTALIRNLGNMTRYGLFNQHKNRNKVVETLLEGDALEKGRVHPLTILLALSTYQFGAGFRGSNSWTPVASIVDALNDAFYKSFGNVEPTGKRYLLALDVSGSMTVPLANSVLSCRDASAAMALVTAAVEKNVDVVGFFAGSGGMQYGSQRGYYRHGITTLNISPRQRLNDAIKVVSGLPFGGTDCALPMLYAKEKSLEIDTFVVYTDSETWAGSVHPAKALKDYRKASGIDARLVVVGMTSNEFSIADPKDPGMLDVVGFDTATPNIISGFAAGTI